MFILDEESLQMSCSDNFYIWNTTRRQLFLPVSLQEEYWTVDCRSVDVWMPVIEFRYDDRNEFMYITL